MSYFASIVSEVSYGGGDFPLPEETLSSLEEELAKCAEDFEERGDDLPIFLTQFDEEVDDYKLYLLWQSPYTRGLPDNFSFTRKNLDFIEVVTDHLSKNFPVVTVGVAYCTTLHY